MHVSPFNLLWLVILAAIWILGHYSLAGDRPLFALPQIGSDNAASTVETSFTICGAFHRDNCVIDGDTFRYGGERIRILDIDAPETHPSRCDYEARLGAEAARRLLDLLNEGPLTLRSSGRDEDRYGRKLRLVFSEGRSVGRILVSEGLAREWTGRRLPWCS